MADSIDRVFGHALHTINKIRTGSQKPPAADRLKLYGLYKQSMEGDVSYIQTRPDGTSEQARKDQEKWDAWNENRGLSRTEAKKRYIETLIQTMHNYASSTPEARELVSELEFVWDQVKNNSNPSESGSHQSSPRRDNDDGAQVYPGASADDSLIQSRGRDAKNSSKSKMRVLSPVSQPAEDEIEEEKDEFVDAPVSQFGEQDMDTTPGDERTDIVSGSNSREAGTPTRRPSASETKWKKRVESALVKMTTEVAALREQLESREYITQRRRQSWFGWLLRAGWFCVKLVVVDVFALWLLILYLRRVKDRRLEGAIRVLLGDAQAVAKNLAAQMQQKVGTKLPSRK